MDSAARQGAQRAEQSANVSKDALRRVVQEGRTTPEPDSATRARLARALACSAGRGTVACYSSTGNEPDTWGLIDALHDRGVTVLLPVLSQLPTGKRRPATDWARYTGREELRPGLWGIPEPTSPTLGADALADAEWIWCSALAATPDGRRLGTGGGWYDRALRFAAGGTTVAALLRDHEVLDDVPTEAWDLRVQAVVTEHRTLWCGNSDPGAAR